MTPEFWVGAGAGVVGMTALWSVVTICAFHAAARSRKPLRPAPWEGQRMSGEPPE